ncbi:MAG TPA: hypothetical protein VN641_00820 [Urbifossiella sp.]|nr:hypothetical protein [Urbifossiella sp.]
MRGDFEAGAAKTDIAPPAGCAVCGSSSKGEHAFGGLDFSLRTDFAMLPSKEVALYFKDSAMNPDLRRRTDDLCSRLAQLRDSL